MLQNLSSVVIPASEREQGRFAAGAKRCMPLLLSCCALTAQAEGSLFTDWVNDIGETRLQTGAVVAGVTLQGVTTWKWGSSPFRTNSEGWFGLKTSSGGTDKMGHAFSSYALTNVLAADLVRAGRSPERAALSAAITSQAIMTYVEVFDGFSGDHGFSHEDVLVNLMGTGLAYVRNVSPRVRDLLDYRMEYKPSGYKGFRPLSDYAGQKFMLALKLNGLVQLQNTPWRFVELHLGYYTRGFTADEQVDGAAPRRFGFVGIGVNLQHGLFGARVPTESASRHYNRLFFEHIQLPGTLVAARWDLDKR